MNLRIKRAMLLAAGLGTRLRPLTYETPKPLLPINEHRLIDLTLSLLAEYGIQSVMINLHHLGHKIREYVGDGLRFGLEAHYSEEPRILGTGGGIKNCEKFFEGEPFIALNADALLQVDVASLIEHHVSSGAGATMVLKPLSQGDTYQPVAIDENGWVTGFSNEGKYFYVGLQVLTNDLLGTLPPAGQNSCLVQDGYIPFIKNGGKVASFIYDGYFNDVGTSERYDRAIRDIETGTFQSPSSL